LKISFTKAGLNVANDFLAVGSAYDEERGPIDDLNAFYPCNGYGVSHVQPPLIKVFFELSILYPEVGKVSLTQRVPYSVAYPNSRFVDGKTGKRSDAASAYLYPVLETNKNLLVLARKRVIRVIFE
jgi:alcohol oxidase